MKILKYALYTVSILIIGISDKSFSQDPGHIYYGQWSAGAGFISAESGRGFPVAGNINGDGIADFVTPVQDMFHVGIASFVNGQLTFNMQQTKYFNPGELLVRATLLDMNNDGKDDCFMVMEDAGTCCPPLIFYSENLELSNDPVVFPQPALLPAVNVPAHFNSDNIIDTVYSVNGEVSVIDGMTGTAYPVISNGYTKIETFHDFNSDGLLDMMFEVIQSASLDTAAVVVLVNQGDFQFERYETRGRVSADQYGDFDNDGVSDIISPAGPGDFLIRTNLLSDDQAETTTYDFPQFSYDISYFVHDLDSDGFSDILVFDNDTSYFCHNKQDQTFEVYAYPFLSIDGLFFAWDSSWGVENLVVQDGTGRPFLYRVSFENGNYQIENRTNYMNPPILPEPVYGYTSAVTDIDHDQNPELLFTIGGSLVYREWEGNGFQFNDYVSDIGITPEYNAVTTLSSGDFNGDGLIDFAYVSNGSPSKLQVKFAQADSTFSAPVTIHEEYGIRRMISADVNGDSIDDLGVAWVGKVILYEGQPDNQFMQTQVYSGYVENLVLIDPNEDNLSDIAITTGDTTKIFMNNAGDFEFTQDLLGKTPKSNQVESNRLMMFVPDQQSVVRYIQLDSLGESYWLIGSHPVPNFINFRTAYQFDYDQDGHMDLCYNRREGDDEVAELVFGALGLGITEMTLNDRSIAGTTDLNLDGVEDIIWRTGPQIHIEITDKNAMTDASELVDSDIDINVFPNPTSGNIYIESTKVTQFESIKIYNTNGTLVSTHTGNTIDMRPMPSGIYILRVTAGDNSSVVKRIVKM
ncbi:MAG: T9SS type A sorting domain-containing protein [Bacteroidota bacterium]